MLANNRAAALWISSLDLDLLAAKSVINCLYDFHHKILANGGTCSNVVQKSGSDWKTFR
jgi:hypothetical protein